MDNDFEIRDDLQSVESVGPRVSLSGQSSEASRGSAGVAGSMIRFNGRRADVHATAITEGMKVAAADALAALVGDELAEDFVVPSPFDERVGPAVSAAVAEAARLDGVARA